jgi:hypothetical protein
MTKHIRVTGKSTASKAASVLRRDTSTAAEKSAAASALVQRAKETGDTSEHAASMAGSVLAAGDSSDAARSAAASALAQRRDHT